MKKRDWTNLIRAIQEQRCILMLGPSLARAEYENEWMSLNEIFALHLAKELEDEGIEYEQEHERNLTYMSQKFFTIPNVRRTDLEGEIKEAYEQNIQTIPPIYEELAKYPFHLIINTNPDDFMLRALHKAGKHNSTSHWYNFRKDSEPEIGNISSETPLVYNLFGSFKKPETLILTEQDQVDFIKSVVRNEPPIPNKIMSQFDERKTYLFLEFDLRNWHFRLMLDGLNLKKESKSLIPKFSKAHFDLLTKEFYQNRFNFNFIDKDLPQFSSELTQKFSVAKEKTKHRKIDGQVRKQNLVILYTDEDGKKEGNSDSNKKDYLTPLVKALKPLEEKHYIKVWHKGMIYADGLLKQQIRQQLNKADIILFLLSSDFLSNPEIEEQEIAPSFVQYKNRQVKIIPILARACGWQHKFANFSILPDNKNPINTWVNIDDALENIVKGLEKIVC